MVDTTREGVKKRLRRIEGQVRGVHKMLEEGEKCEDILQQLKAIRSAVQQASVMMARSYACECLADSSSTRSQEKLVEDLVNVLTNTN